MSQDPELISAYTGITFGRIGSDPQQSNAYSYVANRPTVATDPTGAVIREYTQSGYIDHYTQGSAMASGVTHVNGKPIGGESSGGESGRKSTEEAATGASQSSGPGNTLTPIEQIEAQGVRVAGGNDLINPETLARLHELAKDANAKASIVVGSGIGKAAGFVALSVDLSIRMETSPWTWAWVLEPGRCGSSPSPVWQRCRADKLDRSGWSSLQAERSASEPYRDPASR
jgi:hypothetical protein